MDCVWFWWAPELFNSDGSISETEEETSLSETSITREEEDDLEIPAFWRQKINGLQKNKWMPP